MPLAYDTLDAAFRALPAPPKDSGTVAVVVVRPGTEKRETPDRCALTPDGGLAGDRWGKNAGASPDNQITLMRADFGRLVADGKPLSLFGDNLVVDLDLSESNLPAGTRVRIGSALCEVTPKPHTGCAKYSARFGPDALEIVNGPANKAERLRGIHVRVLEPGEVATGDAIQVLSRPA